MKEKTYIAIDLKSFYASVECVERGLNPLDANLVVADESRTNKTICLAVSPSLKAHGIPGRARLFELKQRIKEVNSNRLRKAPDHKFRGKSIYASELTQDPSLELDLVIAPPRMAYYIDYSKRIIEIYMRYVSFDDILVYSIDEVFIDATPYLSTYHTTAHDFAMKLIRDVLKETHITATAGIGTNLYLAKIAMDIVAKHIPADKDDVRIAELDEMTYRDKLWTHQPLTDFWRVGAGISRKLEQNGLYTMGDIARCSEGAPSDYYNEDLLYRLFGVNAELLIDHAWGWEPTLIADCKKYKPVSKSLSQGQVLSCPYNFEDGRTIVQEMADQLSIELVRSGLFTEQVVLDVGFDIDNMTDPRRIAKYKGAVVSDQYGRQVPKPVHGSKNLSRYTSSTNLIINAVTEIYDKIVDRNLLVRRFTVTVTHLIPKDEAPAKEPVAEQLDLFTNYETLDKERKSEAMKRNKQIGGHNA